MREILFPSIGSKQLVQLAHMIRLMNWEKPIWAVIQLRISLKRYVLSLMAKSFAGEKWRIMCFRRKMLWIMEIL